VADSFCFVIEPWNAAAVEAELRKRGLTPVADNDGNGFESFQAKDPDSFNLQISFVTHGTRLTSPTARESEKRRWAVERSVFGGGPLRMVHYH
jgi:hypothetical protein